MGNKNRSYAKNRRAEQTQLKRNKKLAFRAKLKSLPNRYFIDAMGAMAMVCSPPCSSVPFSIPWATTYPGAD